MKQRYALVGCLGFAAASLLLLAMWTVQRRRAEALAVKADSYDEICAAVKASVDNDIFFLGREDEPMRRFVLEQYENRWISARVRMFGWCTHDSIDLETLAGCSQRRDYPCVVQILKAVSARIPAGG